MQSEGPTRTTFIGEETDDVEVDHPIYESTKRRTDTTVSLIDIAKPAKRKGKPSTVRIPRNLKNF